MWAHSCDYQNLSMYTYSELTSYNSHSLRISSHSCSSETFTKPSLFALLRLALRKMPSWSSKQWYGRDDQWWQGQGWDNQWRQGRGSNSRQELWQNPEQAAAPEDGHPWSSWVQVGVGGVPGPTPPDRGAASTSFDGVGGVPAPTPLDRGAAILGVTCSGDSATLIRPCVDCGLWTGRFCDCCLASDRMPEEQWAEGQLTPLCSTCDNKHDMCHFCRGLLWCMPAPWGHNSGANPSQSYSQ